MHTTHLQSLLCLLILSMIAALSGAQDLDSGLITHFKFDEVSGNIAYDSSTSDFDTQVLGGTEWGEGLFDGAIDFNGLDAKIDLGQPSEYDMTSFSIACWFKNNDAGQFRVITARNSQWKNRQWWLTLWQAGYSNGRDAKLVFRMSPVSGKYVDLVSTKRVDDNEWHAAVVTVDSTNGGTAKLYLDNLLQHTITGFGVPKIPNSPAYVGRDVSGSKRFYKGLLDDFRIYNRALTPEEVALFSESPPQVLYVRTRGSDSNDGTTPGTAFRTIQHAVNSCTLPGNTVYVGPGTYFESVEIGLNAGSEAVSGTADNPTELIADPTGEFTFDNPGSVVIDGRDSSTSGISLTSIENWIIDGFTFENQRTYGIYGSSIGAQINNCIFDVPAGYAIYATATGDIKVADCTFNRNSDSAHAMWITPSNTTDPTSVLITRNDMSMKDDAYLSTGFQTGSSAIWSRPRNNRYTYGIIIYGFGSPLIDRVEISNNQISDFYLPIYAAVNSSSAPSTIIANNTVTGSLYSIYSYAYSTQTVTLINNIIDTSYFGMLSYTRSNASQTVSGHLESNLTMDMARYRRSFEDLIINGSPRFTDAAAGDFSLIEGSPAIDAGTSTDAPTVDIFGRARPVDGDEDEIAQIDLGAYELVTERQKLKMVQWREISGHRDMSSE